MNKKTKDNQQAGDTSQMSVKMRVGELQREARGVKELKDKLHPMESVINDLKEFLRI